MTTLQGGYPHILTTGECTKGFQKSQQEDGDGVNDFLNECSKLDIHEDLGICLYDYLSQDYLSQ